MRTCNLILLSFLLSACHHRLPLQTNRFERVVGQGYAYQRMDDGAVIVAAKGQVELKQAMNEVGCGVTYVCTVEVNGQIYEVTQKRK